MSSLTLDKSGDFLGYFTLGALDPGYVAGYMTHVPSDWQIAFGGPAVTGQFALAIVTRTSLGPSLFAFDPDSLGDSPAPLKPLLYYPSSHPTLGTWDNTDTVNIYYNMSTESGGVLFPENSRSVLFIGSQGFGRPGYGAGTDDSTLDRTPMPDYPEVYYCYDPNRDGKGCHAFPYYYCVWAYDASELAMVASGKVNPWDIKPYAVWKLPLPFTPKNARISIGGVGYDAENQRVYICQKNADGSSARPIIHVFNLNITKPLSSNTTPKIPDKTPTLKSSGSNIVFTISKPGHYLLSVYSTDGRFVETLMDSYLSTGTHSKHWRSTSLQNVPAAQRMYCIQLYNLTTHNNTAGAIMCK